jgi:hypothetical protein
MTEASETVETQEQPVTVLPNTTTEKIEFNAAQQALVDRLIKESQGRAAKDLRTRVQELEKERGLLLDQVNGREPNADELSRLKAQIADERLRADQATAQAEQLAKTTFQQNLAQKFNHVDPDTSTKLLQNNLRFDAELKTYVAVDDSGVTRLNADGTPMLGEQLYNEFSSAKPWLVRSTMIFGTGERGSSSSSPQIDRTYDVTRLYGPGATKDAGRILNELSLRDNRKYQLLRADAKRKQLIP